MSNWTYVAIAYTVVWGSLALYALLLARRVTQARDVARRLSESSVEEMAEGRATASRPYDGQDRGGKGLSDRGRMEARGRQEQARQDRKEQDGAACDVPPAP